MRYRFKFVGMGLHVQDGKDVGRGQEFESNVDVRNQFSDGDSRFLLMEDRGKSKVRRTSGRKESSGEPNEEGDLDTSTGEDAAQSETTDDASETVEGVDESDEGVDDMGEEPRSCLQVAPRGAGWYDVYNPETGKVVNSRALRHEEAVALAKE